MEARFRKMFSAKVNSKGEGDVLASPRPPSPTQESFAPSLSRPPDRPLPNKPPQSKYTTSPLSRQLERETPWTERPKTAPNGSSVTTDPYGRTFSGFSTNSHPSIAGIDSTTSLNTREIQSLQSHYTSLNSSQTVRVPSNSRDSPNPLDGFKFGEPQRPGSPLVVKELSTLRGQIEGNETHSSHNKGNPDLPNQTWSAKAIQNRTGSSYVDLIDAVSTIRPDYNRSRHKATGKRDYGEDVADRNIADFGAKAVTLPDSNPPKLIYGKDKVKQKQAKKPDDSASSHIPAPQDERKEQKPTSKNVNGLSQSGGQLQAKTSQELRRPPSIGSFSKRPPSFGSSSSRPPSFGPSSSRPSSAGPGSTVQHSVGAPSMGPPSNRSTSVSSNRPPSMGPPPRSPSFGPPLRPPSFGPSYIRPSSAGRASIGPHSVGLLSGRTAPTGPTSVRPPSIGPPPTGRPRPKSSHETNRPPSMGPDVNHFLDRHQLQAYEQARLSFFRESMRSTSVGHALPKSFQDSNRPLSARSEAKRFYESHQLNATEQARFKSFQESRRRPSLGRVPTQFQDSNRRLYSHPEAKDIQAQYQPHTSEKPSANSQDLNFLDVPSIHSKRNSSSKATPPSLTSRDFPGKRPGPPPANSVKAYVPSRGKENMKLKDPQTTGTAVTTETVSSIGTASSGSVPFPRTEASSGIAKSSVFPRAGAPSGIATSSGTASSPQASTVEATTPPGSAASSETSASPGSVKSSEYVTKLGTATSSRAATSSAVTSFETATSPGSIASSDSATSFGTATSSDTAVSSATVSSLGIATSPGTTTSPKTGTFPGTVATQLQNVSERTSSISSRHSATEVARAAAAASSKRSTREAPPVSFRPVRPESHPRGRSPATQTSGNPPKSPNGSGSRQSSVGAGGGSPTRRSRGNSITYSAFPPQYSSKRTSQASNAPSERSSKDFGADDKRPSNSSAVGQHSQKRAGLAVDSTSDSDAVADLAHASDAEVVSFLQPTAKGHTISRPSTEERKISDDDVVLGIQPVKTIDIIAPKGFTSKNVTTSNLSSKTASSPAKTPSSPDAFNAKQGSDLRAAAAIMRTKSAKPTSQPPTSGNNNASKKGITSSTTYIDAYDSSGEDSPVAVRFQFPSPTAPQFDFSPTRPAPSPSLVPSSNPGTDPKFSKAAYIPRTMPSSPGYAAEERAGEKESEMGDGDGVGWKKEKELGWRAERQNVVRILSKKMWR